MTTPTADWRDSGGTLHKFQTEPGDGASPEERPVHGLPGALATALLDTASRLATVITSLATIDGHVDGLEGLAGSLNGYVDGLEGLATTLNALVTTQSGYVDQLEGYTDGLETLIGTTNTALTTLQGYVDGLETLIGTTNTNLATLHTDLSPPTVIYAGNKNVTTAGTSVALAASQALVRGEIRIRGKDANTGLVYINPGATAGSSGTGGDRLAPGEPMYVQCHNLADVSVDAAVSGEGVTYSAC